MKPGVSIVLCTYNGAERLPETLKHLAAQNVREDVPWEIIIVNNASSDNTAELVKHEWAKYNNPVPFSLLYQGKQGLTYAREMAFEASQYDYILMCDDDNWLDPGYINIAYDLMYRNSNIGVLGGIGELVYETVPPYHAKALPLFANGAQAKAPGKVPRNYVYGAGSVIRKSAYDSLLEAGFKPLLSDRVGPNLNSGGDFEICFALVLAGYDIWYDNRLKFKHFMEKERLTWEYYIRFLRESSVCFEVLDPYEFVTTFGCTNLISFHKRYLQGIFYHIRKISRLYLKRFWASRGSDPEKVLSLRIYAYEQRLIGYRRYSIMKQVFLNVLRLKIDRFAPISQRLVNNRLEVEPATKLSGNII